MNSLKLQVKLTRRVREQMYGEKPRSISTVRSHVPKLPPISGITGQYRNIEITTKALYHLRKLTSPQGAGKSYIYRKKEVSQVVGGINAFDGIYDAMYDSDEEQN